MAKISIGAQSFEELRTKDLFYVDKTDFVKEWWENEDVVTLITRPRRFGKTLNLSLLECFFSGRYEGRSDLFEGLSIWKDEKYRKLQGTCPVIRLSFADIKGSDFENTRDGMISTLQDVYQKHAYLLEGDKLSATEKRDFYTLGQYVEKDIKKEITDDTIARALKKLMSYMVRYHDQKVIVLLDEYDTPLQEAYVYGYWEQLTALVRSMFNSTFKTNEYLCRGLLTGITRVSRESIFSDLNNLEVVTTTSEKYRAAFGFTEQEVAEALDQFGMGDTLDKVRFWYDGFCFGGCRDIYNPWSITKYLDSGRFQPYWANTSSNGLIGKLLRESSSDVKIAMEDLLADRFIETTVDEEIIFDQLDGSTEAIWSLLLASGYLKVEAVSESDGTDEPVYRLSLTNFEVKRMFRKMIRGWFKNPSVRYNEFIRAMLANDLAYMNDYMSEMVSTVFSYFDTGDASSQPERFYHGFVLGLIVDAQLDYLVTSNRESGLGRYDVVLEPRKKDANAYVLEFKAKSASSKAALSDLAREALRQIADKQYDAALIGRGIPKEKIYHYGFAFDGSKVLIAGESCFRCYGQG